MIYQDPSREVPSVYGPMVYTLFAIPGRFKTGGNPLLPLRFVTIAAFLLCVAMAASITRALVPHRNFWLWSVLLALSFSCMSRWPLQIRGDFIAIFFSLAALRLLLSRSLAAALLAGACAGFATQFKFTYVAAILAGLLWLMANRRWKPLAVFAIGCALTSIGFYAFYIWREPWLLPNVLALRHPIVDYTGIARTLFEIGKEPVTCSALPHCRSCHGGVTAAGRCSSVLPRSRLRSRRLRVASRRRRELLL